MTCEGPVEWCRDNAHCMQQVHYHTTYARTATRQAWDGTRDAEDPHERRLWLTKYQGQCSHHWEMMVKLSVHDQLVTVTWAQSRSISSRRRLRSASHVLIEHCRLMVGGGRTTSFDIGRTKGSRLYAQKLQLVFCAI